MRRIRRGARAPAARAAGGGPATAAAATALLLLAVLLLPSSSAGPASSSLSPPLDLPTEFGAAAPALMRMSDDPAEKEAPAAPRALPTGGWAPAAQAVGGGAPPAFAPAEPANAAKEETEGSSSSSSSSSSNEPTPAAATRIPSVAGYTPLWMKDQGAAALARQQLERQQRAGGGGANKAGGSASLLKALAKRAVDPTGAASDDDGGADYAQISEDGQGQRKGLLSSLLGGASGGGGGEARASSNPPAASLPEFEDDVYLPEDQAEALIAGGQAVDAGSNLRVAAGSSSSSREAAPKDGAAAASPGTGTAKLLGSLGALASLLNGASEKGGSGGGGNNNGNAGGTSALAGLAGALGGALRASGGGGDDESRGLGSGGSEGAASNAAASLKAAAGQGAAGAAVVAKGLATVFGLPTDLPDKALDLPTAKQAIAGVLASIDLSKVDLGDVSGSLERLSGDALRGLDSTLAGAGQSATQYVSQLSANMKPPRVQVAAVEVTRVAVYGWSASQALSGVVDGVGGGGVAGAVVGGAEGSSSSSSSLPSSSSSSDATTEPNNDTTTEIRADATTATTTFDAAAVVGRTVTVSRFEKKASWRVRGTVTVSNVNIVPLIVSGLAVTVATGDAPVPATLAAAAAAAAGNAGGYPSRRVSAPAAIVARVVADCPAASDTSDTIVVPGTPLSSLMPGKLECTFETTLPGDAPADTVGKITAALTVALLPSLSGQVAPPVAFSLANAKLDETGACATVTDTYFTDANAAALALSRASGGGGGGGGGEGSTATTGLAEAAGQLAAPQLAPTEIAAGDKPPSEGEDGAASSSSRVCGPEGRTFLYAARYGPYDNGACGSFASTNVVRVVPDGAVTMGAGAGQGDDAALGFGGGAGEQQQQPNNAFAAGLAGLLGLASGSGGAGMSGGREGGEWFGGGAGTGGGAAAVAVTASAPTGGVSAATLPVSVTGCLPVVVSSVQPRTIRRYSWDAQQQAAVVSPLAAGAGGGSSSTNSALAALSSSPSSAPLSGALPGGDGAAFWAAPGASLPLAYTMRFTRSADVRRVLSGSVVLHNPTARPLTVKSATVMAAPKAAAAGADATPTTTTPTTTEEATDANLLPGCVRADGSYFAPSAVVVPPAGPNGKPGTLTCRFRLELPASSAAGGEGEGGEGEVRAEVSYADDPLGRAREGSAVRYAFGGPGSAVLEVGKCADVRVGFEADDGGEETPAPLRPRSLAGALPPGLAASVGVARPQSAAGGTGGGSRVCSPTSFSFRATFGPFLGECGSARAARTVATATPVTVGGGWAAGAESGGGGSLAADRVVRRPLAVGVAVAGGVCGPVLPSAAVSAAASAAAGPTASTSNLRLAAPMGGDADADADAADAGVASLSGPAVVVAAAATQTPTTPPAAPVTVRIAELTPGVVAAAYSWTLRAGTAPAGPRLSVEPGGSAALTRVLVVRRSDEADAVAPSGAAGYALSGTVEVANPTLSPLPPLRRVVVTVQRPRLSGAGPGAAASLEVPTTCAPGTIVQPGQTLRCAFAVAYPDKVASRAVATAEFFVVGGGTQQEDEQDEEALAGATPAVPAAVRSEPARFFFDKPRAVIAGECASITDDLSLAALAGVAGLEPTGSGAAKASQQLLSVLDDGQGEAAVKAPTSADVASGAAAPLRLCGSGDRSFRYQVLLGPLGGAGRCFGMEEDGGQGSAAGAAAYTLHARAAAAPLVAGAAAAVPSSALRSSVAEAGRGPTAVVISESELAVDLEGC